MTTPTDIFDIGPFGWPPNLVPSADLHATEWLQDPARWKRWDAGKMALPGRVIPLGYTHYFRINHPAWKTVLSKPGMKWYEVIERRVSWKEVAAWGGKSLEDVAFFTDIVPDAAMIPADAPFDQRPYRLSPEVFHLLEPALAALTATPYSTWVSFWDGGRWNNANLPAILDDRTRPDYPQRQQQRQALLQQIQTVPRWAPPGWAPGGRPYWLAHGPVGAVYDLARGIYKAEPNFWWPDDRAWCLSTEIDFDFTLIGTNEEGARRLLAISDLEIYAVNAD
ncbi:hypothetical protein [Sulfobacillus harzensis]|uniref:Uncharacterized protein n=1 Tax=Sulfobacillus harzensis TaxID=2729629 RepID=A0A7Y0L1K1_9FIRM|nr:hypothetical protein [Sulfobacillus harzensis]NMP21599.1 hypothetical protein [Sulfobacillus harzensis]